MASDAPAAPVNIAGNYYDKHGTTNPLARLLVNGFYTAFDALLVESGATRIHEIGCGEGVLALRAAKAGHIVSASDLEASAIAEARRRAQDAGLSIEFTLCDVQSLDAGALRDIDLLVCCEVLEHVPDPAAALARLARSGALLVLMSVPREPLWRALNMARLRYLKDFGNTPGHLNHWGRSGFLAFVSQQFEIVATRAPLPWTFVLARPRPAP